LKIDKVKLFFSHDSNRIELYWIKHKKVRPYRTRIFAFFWCFLGFGSIEPNSVYLHLNDLTWFIWCIWMVCMCSVRSSRILKNIKKMQKLRYGFHLNSCFHSLSYLLKYNNIISTDMIKIKDKINLTVDLHLCIINIFFVCCEKNV
jgi:hypothetical protein